MSTTIWFIALVVLVIVFGVEMYLIRRRQDSAWRQFASEAGAEFVPGGLFRASKVQGRIQQWAITLDTYWGRSGKSGTTYTRIRAPLQSESPFEFTVFREGVVGKLGKALGMQDIEIGIPEFDQHFMIQANDTSKVSSLLADSKIRELIQQQKQIRLRLEAQELYFEAQDVILDVEQLKSLFQLFEATLRHLEG